MSEVHPHQIDEQWLMEWFEFGLREMMAYLAKHAKFETYCAGRV